jgi:ABC-type bacteriocin/lantibiotic exporter with double-glycine peptidase domain
MRKIVHATQNGNAYRNDCGPACIAMLASAYTGRDVTIAQVVKALNNANQFTTIAQLVSGLSAFGVKAASTREASWTWYQQRLDAGTPVIALVDYESYSVNPTNYDYAHFLIITAYTNTKAIVFDPLRDSGPAELPLNEFINSINRQSAYVKGYDAQGKVIKGYNYSNQAVYPIVPDIAPLPLFAARVDAVAGRVKLLAEAG